MTIWLLAKDFSRANVGKSLSAMICFVFSFPKLAQVNDELNTFLLRFPGRPQCPPVPTTITALGSWARLASAPAMMLGSRKFVASHCMVRSASGMTD